MTIQIGRKGPKDEGKGVQIKMDGDQKFIKSMVMLAMGFAAVMTLGGLAISLLLGRNPE